MIIDVLFSILYVLVPIAVIFLAKQAEISLMKVSIPTIFIIAYLVFAYFGILPLYFYWDEYRCAIGVTDRDIILKVFFYSSTSILIIVSGFIFTNKIARIKPIHSEAYTKYLSGIELVMVFYTVVLCVVVLTLYLIQIPTIPLLASIEGTAADVSLLRSKAGNDFSGIFKYHWYYLFFGNILPFITYLLFAHALIRKKICSYLLFGSIFLITLFASVMAAEKAPAVWLVVGLSLTYLLVKRNGRVSLKVTAILMVCTMAMIIPMYILFMHAKDAGSAFTSLLSRIIGSVQPGYHYLEMFPARHDYLLGQSFPNPGGMLPFENYNLAVEMMKFTFPEVSEHGIVGSMPATFWAEIYVNFGPIAPLIVSFFVGAAIYILYALLSRLQNTPVKAALVVWTALHLKDLSESGISSYLVDTYFHVVSIIAIMILFIGGNGRLRYTKLKNLTQRANP